MRRKELRQNPDGARFAGPPHHPHVEKFVEAKPGHEAGLESLRQQTFPANIEVPFKRCDAPSQWTLRENGSAGAVSDTNDLS